MKTIDYCSLGLLAATLVFGGLFFNSCKDDEVEPVPEIVENPLEKNAYFITGKVTDGANSLADVAVSAGSVSAKTDAAGTYLIEVTRKGTFELNFAKEGYITIGTEVTINNDADKGTIVSYSQILTKKADAVKVDPAKDTRFAVTNNTDALIPAGAVKEETDVTITSFVPAADKELKKVADKAVSTSSTQEGSTNLSLSSLYCEPDGAVFDKPLEVKVKADAASDGVYFAEVQHFVNGKESGEVKYDDSEHSYTLLLDGFSVHELKVSTDLSVEPDSEELFSQEVNNLGQTAAVSKDFSFNMKEGWKIISKSNGVTGDVEAKLMDALVNVMSSPEGISEKEFSKNMAVSGDMKLKVVYKQSVVRYTISVKTNRGVEKIVVEQYGSVSQDIEKEQGNMKPEHN